MKNKLKILVIHSRNIFAQDSASANRWRTMVEGLINEGIEIHIIFTQGYGSIEEVKKFGWRGDFNGIHYSYSIFLLHNSLWMRRISGYLISPLLKRLNVVRVEKEIIRTNPLLLWLQPSIEVFDIYLNLAKKLNHIKYKLMIELNEYNDIGLIHSTNSLQLEISKRYSRLLLTEILPKTNLAITISKKLLNYYQKFTVPGKAKFLHFPMTVDINRFNLSKTSSERYIAYCGSSSFVKDGVDVLLKSFSLITHKFPAVRLKIAAFMEADGVKMLALINELNIQEKVDYLGALQRDDIPAFIINAEALMLPRPDSKQAQGGFPTKLGEYLASSNPVCATTVGELPDYLTDNESVFFAEPGSIDSFTHAMERALSDPENAKRIGKNGRRVAELYFNMDVQAKTLKEFIYQQIT